ncbi:MAG TPA: hypothetical protein DCL77_14315 [Prolixibacteraceae bacterium]|nr:hypothetical protein [Prolixibacteraceae bacterium]
MFNFLKRRSPRPRPSTSSRKPTFTIDCIKHCCSPFDAYELGLELHMNPIRKGNTVTITPIGETREDQAEWIALFFYNLGHSQRIYYLAGE